MSSQQETEPDTDPIPEGMDVQAVLRDVEDALRQVAGLDISFDDPGDLDRIKRVLPTEPTRAELVHAGLPDWLRESIEYVHPSDRQSGYWRRSRERSDPRALSDAEIRKQAAFIDTNRDLRGVEGTVETPDGRRISRTAKAVGDRLRGRKFSDPDRNDDGENGFKLFRRITKRL